MIAMMMMIPSFGQEKTLKRKVAIGRFTNETQYAKGVFYELSEKDMEKIKNATANINSKGLEN